MSLSQLRTQPEKVEVAGVQIKCLLCTNDVFHRRKTHFDTALNSGLSPDWADSQGFCLVCAKCGFIHSFMSIK